MTKHARQLTHEELITITEFSQRHDAFTRNRASAILLSAKGKGTSEIADAVGMSERYARHVVLSFNRHGMQAMQKGKSSGRPCTLSDSQRKAFLELINRQPKDFGVDRDTWTLRSLADVLRSEEVCSISTCVLQRDMKRLGVDWTELKLRGTVRIPVVAHAADAHSEAVSEGSFIRRGPYADRMLRLGERELYDEIIESLKNDYAVTGNALHMELAAIYSVRIIGAQASGDWEQAERFDRMMHSHLRELKAARRKQDEPDGTDDPVHL